MSKSKNKQDALMSTVPILTKIKTRTIQLEEWILDMPNSLKNSWEKITNRFWSKINAGAFEGLPPVDVIDMEALMQDSVSGKEVKAMVAKGLADALVHKIDKSH